MPFAALKVLEQACWVVRRGDAAGVAIWTEYEIGGARDTELVVLAPERVLLPRDRIAHGVRDAVRGLTRERAAQWLEEAGYRMAPGASRTGPG